MSEPLNPGTHSIKHVVEEVWICVDICTMNGSCHRVGLEARKPCFVKTVFSEQRVPGAFWIGM